MISRCVCLIALLFLMGCDHSNQGTVPLQGKILNGGAPLAVRGREMGLGYVELQCYRIADDGSVSRDPADAAVEENGDFTVRGRDGHGVPPGRYKITVRQLDPAPDNDRLNGRFNLQNTPIVREVNGDEIVIDLAQPGA
jgi:hypothetical protein